MGWRYRDSFRILPGVRLNFSDSGISLTFGTRGFSINMGKRGIFSNISIPGTGIYRRDHIHGYGSKSEAKRIATYQPSEETLSEEKIAFAKYYVGQRDHELNQLPLMIERGILDQSQAEARINEIMDDEKYVEMKMFLMGS